MYFHLAMRNVKKSFKEYVIYFLTLAFSVCLFYTFNSFQDQQAVLVLSTAQGQIMESLQVLMQIISIIVALTLAFLIKYANSFLIKRRKKEFGIYTLLGMPKPQMTRMLIYETCIVGLISLIVGIICGVLASQLLTAVTANLFEVELNYRFIFSMDTTILTTVVFAVIFLLIMFFNSFSLNRYKLIDLLLADRKNESLKTKNIVVSVIIFLIACALLTYAYYRSYVGGMMAFTEIAIIAPCGIIGTVLFFMSLSGFLLKFVQCSKSLYYKRLNMFVLRQVNVSINSNFLSMSIVCIMLLLSIGALATGANMNKTINNTIAVTTPYDYSFANIFNDYSNESIDTIKEDLNIDTNLIKEETFVHEYESDIPISSFTNYFVDTSAFSYTIDDSFEVLPLSAYNRLREARGFAPITLGENEAYMYSTMDVLRSNIEGILEQKPVIPLYGKSIQITNEEYDVIGLGTTNMTSTFNFGVVVQDQVIPSDAQLYGTYWNVNLHDDAQIDGFSRHFAQQVEAYEQEHGPSKYNTFNSNNRNEIYENSKGLAVIMTYIGIYLGIIFLIASAVILALQQLSQASDSRQRYQILHKIGAEKQMISHSILFQLCIYFFIPLILAIVHSVAGIYVVNQLVMAFGVGDLFGASLITGSVILCIYGAYFLVTYYGYKRIITKI